MDSQNFDDFLNSMHSIAGNIKRNLNLSLDLDFKSDSIIKTIEKSRDKYIENIDGFSLNERNSHLSEIKDLYEKARDLSDDSIGLTLHSIEYIDKNIKLIDNLKNQLLTNEQKLLEPKTCVERLDIKVNANNHLNKTSAQKSRKVLKTMKTIDKNNESIEKKKKSIKTNVNNVYSDGIKDIISPETNLITSRRSRRTIPVQKSRFNSENFVFTAFKPKVIPKAENRTEPTTPKAPEVISYQKEKSCLKESIEPNPSEPVYCVCKQVSFGQMIKCDNNQCYIEWFHFGCVNLRDKPNGKWFCEKCTQKPIN